MRFPIRTAVWALALILWQCLDAGAAGAAGSPDRVVLQTEQIDSLHWEVTVSLENHELLAAMTLPFRWGHGRCPFSVDSADYRGLRTEYFALKTFYPDSLDHTVLIGLISDLGSGLPPLEPGNGPVARIYFTARTLPKRQLSLDTTFIAPHNTLQIVTPDVRAMTPAFESGRAASLTVPHN
ncbi:MAG: hypothetical protein HY304_03135 [candidate division Zixibacteria bacterium]|nr:hypothetical protein [candidate division Zixibacteria bacterium]